MTAIEWSRGGAGRCPNWETRRSTGRGHRVSQVRCSLPFDHAEPCQNRGIEFGRRTVDPSNYMGKALS